MLRFASLGAKGLAGLLVGLAVWALAFSSETASASGETVTTELAPGWNVAGWTEAEAPVETLFEMIPDLEVAYAWDAEKQTFLWAVREESVHSRTLETLTPGMGLWLYLGGTEPFMWTRELLLKSGVASLQAGWNLVGWGGRDGISTEEALSHLEGLLTASWFWDGVTQDFGQASEGSGQTLARGDALWLEAIDAAQWLQLDGRMRVVFEREVSTAFQAETQAALDDVVVFFARHYNLVVEGITVRLKAESAGCGGGYANETIFMEEGCLNPAPHEYSHAVQEYLATLEPDGSWGTVRYKIGPAWLSEGVANTASAVYRDLAGIDSLDEHREHSRVAAITNPNDLASLEYNMGSGNYPLASAAAHWLIDKVGEQSLYEFYRVRPTSRSWQGAFFTAFGMPSGTFYREFDEYRRELAAGYPRLAGRVIGPDGQGVAGIRVDALPQEEGTYGRLWTNDEGELGGTILDGSYHLSLLPADSPCHLGWHGSDTGFTTDPSQIQLLELRGGEVTELLIELPRPLSELCTRIEGVVVDTNGDPIGGLWVTANAIREVYQQEGYSGQRTPETGSFSLDVRRGGTFEIRMVSRIARECTVSGHGGSGSRVRITVGDEDITGLLVTVVRQPPGDSRWVTCTAAE
ncbi:MAG: hypothetical protein F4Z77_02660 [Dehalococcoidia bacterium]|nr:hypothetical protein [Dehalococcoidia bacterium]MYA53824.1 hypothetical protein [Dehalococcoidia bacterium]